jgi:hypothetical protein
MKTIASIFCSLLLLAGNYNAVAQKKDEKKKEEKKQTESTNSEAKCFDENTKIVNVGVGFFTNSYYNFSRSGSYSYRSSPSLSISYEQAYPKKLGPGYLGLGAYFGYRTSYYRYDDSFFNGNKYYYRHNWTHMFVAARGAYHLDMLMIDKGELYFGVILGLRIQNYSYETNSPDPDAKRYALNDRNVYPSSSLFVGGRYYLSNNIAIFGELGYGISYLTGGVSFKF